MKSGPHEVAWIEGRLDRLLVEAEAAGIDAQVFLSALVTQAAMIAITAYGSKVEDKFVGNAKKIFVMIRERLACSTTSPPN